ncbi:efflux RND transporter periplasmic adaptor subunit [Parasphingorhabdus litoris]|uniref:Efflux RND transporter periplasmic adaptor subunit n=1 Tax=Parasphingorhabdus litoris TaxID=394733 RepID=A0ABN1AJH2_9SPHN|nr:efflux RND transporter periplasmic adaptor subunit [Parasphingorhabdus litoris]
MPRLTLKFHVSALLFLALSACVDGTEENLDNQPKPVKLLKLAEGLNQSSQSLPAVIRSSRSTDLAFQVGGRIVTWNAAGGNEFSKGQIIASLDSRTFRNAVSQAEAQFRNADSEYQRAKRLIAQNAISQSVVESRLAQRQVAQASLDDARKALNDTVIRAPFSGFIGRTYVEQFQNVGAQQTVVTLQSSAVEAIVNVPASFVLNSERVRYFDTFVELDAAPGRRFPAVFSEATGQADQNTQTFEGRFKFKAPRDLVVLTGMTATLFFKTEEPDFAVASTQRLSVPLASIIAEGEKRYVWVVKPGKRTIAKREVKLGKGVGRDVAVISGLKSGETIVAAGSAYLSDGDTVRQWKADGK